MLTFGTRKILKGSCPAVVCWGSWTRCLSREKTTTLHIKDLVVALEACRLREWGPVGGLPPPELVRRYRVFYDVSGASVDILAIDRRLAS